MTPEQAALHKLRESRHKVVINIGDIIKELEEAIRLLEKEDENAQGST